MIQPQNPASTPTDAIASNGSNTRQPEIELGCINLISQLEMQIASARSRSSHVEKASDNTDRLLTVLLNFSDEFLTGEKFEKACQSIEKASFASLAHKEVLTTRSWAFALRSLFGSDACSDDSVRQTYDNLGEALLHACVSVLRQTVATVGYDSATGKMIEQSTAVFVEEFQANW